MLSFEEYALRVLPDLIGWLYAIGQHAQGPPRVSVLSRRLGCDPDLLTHAETAMPGAVERGEVRPAAPWRGVAVEYAPSLLVIPGAHGRPGRYLHDPRLGPRGVPLDRGTALPAGPHSRWSVSRSFPGLRLTAAG